MKTIGRITVMLASTVAGVATATGMASADTQTLLSQGSDYATFWHSSHELIVCDREADGNGFYADYYTTSGAHGQLWDGNGSSGGCGSQIIDVQRFRACEDDAGSDTCTSFAVIKP